MGQLKKCPFCGGEATFIKDTRTIKCKCCGGAFICTNPVMTTLEVAEAWNTRKPVELIVEWLEAEAIELEDNHGDFVECIPKAMAIEIVKAGFKTNI